MWKPERAAKPTSTPGPAAPKSVRPPFGAHLLDVDPSNDAHPKKRARPDYVLYGLWMLVAGLCLQRCLYHLAYLRHDPLALVTISNGQLYENAARDILAHPYWGEQPFFFQGAYAYLLAAGIALYDSVAGGLIMQLTAASLGLALFGVAARTCFGPRTGLVSLCVLLASPGLAFYENKFSSTALGNCACMLTLWAFSRNLKHPSFLHACLLGVSAGLAALGRPNLLLIAPFCAFAVWLVAQRRSHPARALLFASVLTATAVTLAPLALRNFVVTGTPTVFPSHGGGIPFFIGNNPEANGRWNDVGGLLGRQVPEERVELAERLGLAAEGVNVDAAIGSELYRRGFAFIRDQPFDYLALEVKKLWALLGNHAFAHDDDLLGERELLGAAFPFGLPFGVVLGLGALGLALLTQRARASRHERDHAAVCSVVFGLVFATLVANLVWYTAAQLRAPLYIPLAFAAGPALEAAARRLRGAPAANSLPAWAWIAGALLCAQAFYPRLSAPRPSSVHYFNLAHAQEELGRSEAALGNYALATERNPRRPMYWWRRALLAKRMHRVDEARTSLDRLLAFPALPAELKLAMRAARDSLK